MHPGPHPGVPQRKIMTQRCERKARESLHSPIGVRVVTKPQKTVKDVLMKVKEKVPKKRREMSFTRYPAKTVT